MSRVLKFEARSPLLPHPPGVESSVPGQEPVSSQRDPAMKNNFPSKLCAAVAFAAISLAMEAATTLGADTDPAIARPSVNAPVTITDDGPTWTLDNGIVRATVNKTSGNMRSLVYNG